MRRIGRCALNTVTAISLVLCLATAGLWVRSLGHFEQVRMRFIRWPRPDEQRGLYVGFSWYANTLRLEIARHARLPAYFARAVGGGAWVNGYRASNPPGVRWEFDGDHVTSEMNGFPPGFAARHYPDRRDPTQPADRWILATRPWLPTLLAALLPAARLRRLRKSRRARRHGRCAACGYDLTGNLSGTCPECGTPVSK